MPLGEKQLRTLMLMRQHPGENSGADLARMAYCSTEAMCNRLVVLERYGLVKSNRVGRERLWVLNCKP